MEIVAAIPSSVTPQQITVNTVVASSALALRMSLLSPNPLLHHGPIDRIPGSQTSVFIRDYKRQLRHRGKLSCDRDGRARRHVIAMNIAERNWPSERGRFGRAGNDAHVAIGGGNLLAS